MLVDKSRTDSVRLVFTIRRDVSLKIRNYELPMLPPFTISVWPVMKDAIGEARKSAAWEISSGSPLRPSGLVAEY